MMNENNLLWIDGDGWIGGKCRKPNFGIFGSCRSQTKELVRLLCMMPSGMSFSQDSPRHQSGQKTVDIICSAFRALPGIQTLQTPPNSSADVHWKWDVIIEYQNKFYPLQIKSGIDDIWKCQGRVLSKIKEIEDEIGIIWEREENKINGLMIKFGWETRENKSIVSLEKDRNQKINVLQKRLEEHKHRVPLFIWATEDEETISDLVDAFASMFSIQGSRQEFVEKAIRFYKETKKKHIDAIKPLQTQAFIDRDLTERSSRLSSIHSIQKISKIDKIRDKYPRAYEPWRLEEDRQLQLRYAQTPSIDILGYEFKRKPSAIKSRLKKLGLL